VIYHPDKNYLFVHIQKTGGTSISEALTKHAGATFISPAHLQLQALEFSFQRPFVFAVVRNPWDRLVSWYEMMKRKKIHNDFSKYLLEPSSNGGVVSFSEFIRRTATIKEQSLPESIYTNVAAWKAKQSIGYLKSLSFNQLDYLTDQDGKESYDEIIRFENLPSDFCRVLRPFHPNIHSDWLMRINSNPAFKNYRDYFINTADRRWVAALYEKDIECFKFLF
jgi:chondroitin 4-sulfotransferase 11